MEFCLLNLLNVYWLTVFCVFLALLCSLRACHMWLTRNHMFIREIWGEFTSFIFWNFVSFGRFQNFKKVNSVNLSQISLLSMWILVQILQQTKVRDNFKILIKNTYSNIISPNNVFGNIILSLSDHIKKFAIPPNVLLVRKT